jgi:hypothetical protein
MHDSSSLEIRILIQQISSTFQVEMCTIYIEATSNISMSGESSRYGNAKRGKMAEAMRKDYNGSLQRSNR